MKKILILAANPKGTTPLRLEKEIREIELGLERAKRRDQFKLIKRQAVRPIDLRRAILDERPQIVHFSGHGDGENGLVFEDEFGGSKFVDGEALAGLFSLFSNDVECVVLNGCFSEIQANIISQHIAYVIGMSQAIGDDAAIQFAIGFYDALGAGNTYKFAYDYACNAIQLEQASSAERELTPLDTAKKLLDRKKQEHLIPVFLKRDNLKEEDIYDNRMLDNLTNASVADKSSVQPEAFSVGEAEFLFDVYISYVDKDPDSKWVWDILLPKLEDAELRVAVSGDSDRPGVARVVNIQQGLQQAKRTILVLTENYLSDNMAEFENALVQTIGIAEGTYRLLPVKVTTLDGINLPPRLSMLSTLDLSHPRREKREFDRLITALKGPLPQM